MSLSGSESDNFDEEQDVGSFTIKPYQYEPRINSDDADSNPEGRSGDEGKAEKPLIGCLFRG